MKDRYIWLEAIGFTTLVLLAVALLVGGVAIAVHTTEAIYETKATAIRTEKKIDLLSREQDGIRKTVNYISGTLEKKFGVCVFSSVGGEAQK